MILIIIARACGLCRAVDNNQLHYFQTNFAAVTMASSTLTRTNLAVTNKREKPGVSVMVNSATKRIGDEA